MSAASPSQSGWGRVSWALVAEGAQLVFGLASFSLLALWMDVDQFGIYAAAVAYSTLAMTLGYLGSQQILMLDVAAGVSFPTVWKRTLSVVLIGSFTATALLVAGQPLILAGAGRWAFGAIVLAQTAVFGVIDFGVIAAQAHRDLRTAAVIRCVSGVLRLLSVGVFGLLGGSTFDEWAPLALLGWAVAALVVLDIVRRRYGAPFSVGRTSSKELARGRPFVFAASSQSVLDAADRPMLVAYGFEADAGRYATAYRFASLASLPLLALVRSTDADFYEDGAAGPDRAVNRARKMAPIAAAYGVLVAIVLFVGAPLIPAVLGDDYSESTQIIRALSVLPLIRGLQIFFANALTG